MERRKLGAAGLDVPAVGLGTWRTLERADRHGPGSVDELIGNAIDTRSNLIDS